MSPKPERSLPSWVVVTAYPRWPSPYFAHLHRYAPPSLPLVFRSNLAEVAALRPPGVVNLHRLKRLYSDPTSGRRTATAARRFLHQLVDLRRAGWRSVWTVHNLLPIDTQGSRVVDLEVANGVLALADAIICHTNADATWLGDHTDAPIHVSGWTGLDAPETPPTPDIAELMARMDAAPVSMLLLGHLTEYKSVPTTINAFLNSTSQAHLLVAGAPDRGLELPPASNRVTLYPQRVPPEQAGHLYAHAHAAVCPYRVDDAFAFFTDVLYPGSVATATGFGVDVIAPALPAIEEITRGRRRWLAPVDDPEGLGPAMARAETEVKRETSATPDSPQAQSVQGSADRGSADWWSQIGQIYRALSAELLTMHPTTTTTTTHRRSQP